MYEKKKHFTFIKNKHGDITEIYYLNKNEIKVYPKNKLYSFDQIIFMIKNQKLNLKYIGPKKKQKNIPSF